MNSPDRFPRLLLAGLVVLTLARLGIAAFNELSADEAYYFMWSQRLDWSYYSKGPGIATALWLSTSLFGDGVFGIRLLSPLLALGSSLVVWRLARSMFDARVAGWTVLLLNLTPIFNAGALVMTIDPLSIFFWLLAMLFIWRALHRNAAVGAYWPLAGLAMGIGFLCKYTNAIQLASLILLLACSRRWRPLFLKPGIYAMLGMFALCTIPVFVWNAGNDWITFTHLKERGSLDDGGFKADPVEWLTFVAGHLFVYSPLLFVGLAWALVRGTRQLGKGNGQAFLTAFALPIVVLYFILSLKKSGELNWTAPGFISMAALLPYYWRRSGAAPRRKMWVQNLGLGLAAAFSLLLMNSDVLRTAGLDCWPYAVEKTVQREGDIKQEPEPAGCGGLAKIGDFSARLRAWGTSAGHVAKWARAVAADSGGEVFLIANRYQTAAAFNYYLPEDLPIIRPTPRHPRVHTVESPIAVHQFSFWPSYDEIAEIDQIAVEGGDTLRVERSAFRGANALYISDDAKRETPPQAIQRNFADWQLVDIVHVLRRGLYVRTLKIFACYGYAGSDL